MRLQTAIIGEKTQENQGIQANVQYPYQLPLLLHTQFQRIRHGMLRKIFSAPSLKPLIILFMPISPIIAGLQNTMYKFCLVVGLVISLIFVLFRVGSAQEVELEVELEEIVITATKTEKRLKEVPASVSIVTKEEIEARKVQNVDEALKTTVGCAIRRGKGLMDSMARVTLRGFSGQERTLVMLDGQPLNNAYTGGVQWSSIPVEEIERIEVVRGPLSSLYGGNAMAGVINIITKIPKEREIICKSSYGAYNTYTYQAGYRDKLGRLGLSLGYDKKHSDGYVSDLYTATAKTGKKGINVTGWEKTKDPKGGTVYLLGDKGRNGAEDEGFSARLSLDLTSDSLLSLGMISRQYQYWYEYGQSYLEDAAGNRVNKGDVWIDDEGTSRYFTIYPSNFLNGPGGRAINTYILGYDHQLNEYLRLKVNGGLTDVVKSWYISPIANKSTEGGGGGEWNNTPSQGVSTDLQLDITGPVERNTLTIGTGYRHDQVESKKWGLSDWRDEKSTTDLLDMTKGKADTSAFYLQDEIGLMKDPTQTLTLFLGTRYDFWRTYEGMNEDRSISPSKLNEYRERQGDSLSPKAAIIYNYLPTLTTLRLSGGKAFRPPNIYELYKTWTTSWGTKYQSNPDLKPEETTSWEAGIEQGLLGERLKLKATYFENHITDLIYTITDLTDPKLKKKMNAAKGKTKGVELEIDHSFNQYLSCFANLSFVDPRIVENPGMPETEGRQVTYVPAEVHSLGMRIQAGRIKGGISGRYTGKMYAQDDNSDLEEGVYGSYDSYLVMDTQWSYEIVPEFKLSVCIDNIFDRQYYQYYKAPGRTYTAGLEVSF